MQKMSFEDNRILSVVLGEFDANLALIETLVDVSLVPHGNIVTIKATEHNCALVADVLDHLYQRAALGHDLTKGDVEGAVSHAQNAEFLLDKSATKKAEKPAGQSEKTAQKPKVKNGQGQIITRKKHITARTPKQSTYIYAMEQKDLIFATGPAGTGKTYLAVAFAASMLEKGMVDKIILSRPAVEAGERLGFLPGDMKEKVDPYLRPLYDALYDTLPRDKVDKDIEAEVIEIAPLAFMRGRTLANSFVILDEAQNTTSMQMKMLLTRLGEGSKMVITGDPSQIDLPKGEVSGLGEAVALLSSLDEVEHIGFSGKDVVRRKLVAKIVAAYDKISH